MAAKANKLPTECLPGLRDELDPWVIYCIDCAVMTFHGVIEHALSETNTFGVGASTRTEPKYSLDHLLDADFRLLRPLPPKGKGKGIGQQVKMLFGTAPPRKDGRKKKGKGQPPMPGLVQKWLERKGLL